MELKSEQQGTLPALKWWAVVVVNQTEKFR